MPSPLLQTYITRMKSSLQRLCMRSLAITFIFAVIFTSVIVGVLYIGNAFQAPAEGGSERITITPGTSTRTIAFLLHDEGIIRSPQMFLLLTSVQDRTLQAGTYNFEEPLPLRAVIDRLDRGDVGDVYTRIRIREGAMLREIAEDIHAELPHIDPDAFVEATEGLEGYLFPETYFVLPETTLDEFITIAQNQFQRSIDSIQEYIDASSHSLEDIVIMASIIEKEATNDFEEQRTIAGILWKRIDEGMLLQVDAPFMYSIGKGSAQLTRSDLQMDSPYNTYRYLGLPPTPIGSPSLSALRAAADPLDSPYYFYLHGNDGIIRYGRNFDEHIINRQRHLRLR